MSREIKFRAWAFASKCMFYPESESGWEIEKGRIKPLPNTDLMQYTGLKDSTGKEIYEGDIYKNTWNLNKTVYFESSRNCETTGHGTSDMFISVGLKMDCVPEEIEIIGNIHENPGLLK